LALNEIRTFKDIQDAVISRGKLDGNKTAVRNEIREMINTFYQHVAFKRNYRWVGESRPITFKKKVTAGTIAVTNASDIITGTGTAFTQFDHEGAKIAIGASTNTAAVNYPFKILRVASSTSITIDSPYSGNTASSVNYTIYKDEIGLFPDLMNIRKLSVPGLGRQRFIIPVSPEEIDRVRFRFPFRSGAPERYTLYGKNIYTGKTWADFLINTDFWEDDFDSVQNNKNLIIWPAVQTSDLVANLRYTKIPRPLGSDDDIPLIPYENRLVLVYGTLAENFLKQRDLTTTREWEKRYRQILKEMESDIETIDAELILTVDRRSNRVSSRALFDDDEIFAD